MSLFRFTIPIKVQEKDVNFRKHVAHEKYLLFFMEARFAYLSLLGITLTDIDGYGTIIAEARCSYKKELRLGDDIEVKCRISEIQPKAFVMDYHILKGGEICATGATTSLYFDYGEKKVAQLPDRFVRRVKAYEGLS